MNKWLLQLPVAALLLFGCVLGINDNKPPQDRIYIEGTKFYINSSPVFMCGANTPWHTWEDFGGESWNYYDHDWWNSHYSQFSGVGLNSSRVWISCSGESGSIIIDESGYVSGATDKHWEDLDDFFQMAQDNGVYIMATLLSFDHFKNTYSTYQRWRNWISSDSNVDSYIGNYLVPFLERYGDYSSLWSIDLMNEAEWITDTENSVASLDWALVQSFFAKAAKTIHDNSSVLVTAGIAVIKYNSDTCAGTMGNKISDEALRAQLDDPSVYMDFWSTHWYDWMNPYWDVPMYVTPADFGLDDSRPSLIGETPANGTSGNSLADDYNGCYTNGWAGMLPWTSNGVDAQGGWDQVSAGASAFQSLYSDAVFP